MAIVPVVAAAAAATVERNCYCYCYDDDYYGASTTTRTTTTTKTDPIATTPTTLSWTRPASRRTAWPPLLQLAGALSLPLTLLGSASARHPKYTI